MMKKQESEDIFLFVGCISIKGSSDLETMEVNGVCAFCNLL